MTDPSAAAALLKKKSKKPASSPKKSTSTRVPHPWLKIKDMYEAGKTKQETAESLKIKLSSMNGIMDRLAAGVTVDGKVIKVTRRHKKAPSKKGK